MYVLYAAFVHVAGRDVAPSDEVAKPLCRVGVELVVIGTHCRAVMKRAAMIAAPVMNDA